MAAAWQDRAVTAISLCALIALWWGVATLVATPRTLPGPMAVGAILWADAVAGPLFQHLGATLGRVAIAFALAMGCGTVLGIALGMMPRLNRWLDPWLVVALNLPALIVIVLCYLWIGLNETAAIVAVAFNKTATVAVAVREGARTLDRPLADMARVYRLSWATQVRHVVLPQLAPYITGAARNGLAIIWKLVLVVEFLGRPDGIGYQIHLYFQLFDVASVMAYALSFVVVMLAIEYGLMQRWERRARLWRGAATA